VTAVVVVAGTNAWVRAESRGRSFASAVKVPGRRVAIVPGASVHEGRPMGTLTGRLETALALYRAHQVKTILVSGNDTAGSPEVGAMHAWLREHGVPERDIWSDPRGSRTRATMLNAAETFDVTDAVVCTQAPYVDRAVFLARHAGIDAVGVALPSGVARSARGLGLEAAKTSLAFFETYLSGSSAVPGKLARGGDAVAVR
jgi:vancomycin permeability regulator SanA